MDKYYFFDIGRRVGIAFSEISLMDINDDANLVSEDWRKVYIKIMEPKK